MMKVLLSTITLFLSLNLWADAKDLVLSEIENLNLKSRLVSKCPADYYSGNKKVYQSRIEFCAENRLSCVKGCFAGKYNQCFGLAIVLEREELEGKGIDKFYPDVLFSESCKLGLIIGCTNRTSRLMKYEKEGNVKCIAKSFETTCNEKDPWGCSMFAFFLLHGIGVKSDLNRALKLIETSCIRGIEDPACQYAKSIEKDIKSAIRKNQP